MSIKILIASDHAGYDLKTQIINEFKDQFELIDLGTNSKDSVDYPDYGHQLASAIENKQAEWGILVCGTGIGISIAANRNSQVRCGVCTDSTMARLTRAHNNANVLALGERLVGTEVAFDIVKTFFDTKFEGGRHTGRVDKL